MYQIKQARPEDAKELVAIQVAAFAADREICGSGPPGYDDPQHLVESMGKYCCYTVWLKNVIVGGFYYHLSDGCLYLLRLFVEPDFQGKGIGTFVIRFLKEQLEKGERVELETPDFSLRVQQFYQRCGFEYISKVAYVSGCSHLYRYVAD